MTDSDHQRDAKSGKRRVPLHLSRDGRIDSTAALLAKPYDYVRETCARLGSDLFESRLLLRRTICMRGPEAAELFYDESRFKRRGAMPEPVRATLLGKGGVQGLDDEAHRLRKAMFMSLMSDERVERLAQLVEREWLKAISSWTSEGEVMLYDAIQPILMRAVCKWAAVPLSSAEEVKRTRDVVALFDQAATLGLGHLKARIARRRSERWLAAVIEDTRTGRICPANESALAVVAGHRDASGELLPPRIAAVELLNVLRTTVAVSVYIVFVAHALHRFPENVPESANGDCAVRFAQEVRRFYPFFPALIARTRRAFRWKGVAFPKGRQVLLDLHGTNCSEPWSDPEEFRPERFIAAPRDPFMFIPQGGGDHHRHHRCPGEPITLALMKVALRLLTSRIAYHVPPQNLHIDRTRLPALPMSRFHVSVDRLLPDGASDAATWPS